jgi:uncharacterized protein YciI
MKTICSIALLLILSLAALAQKANPDYDSTLARRLGADERGMKMYVLVLLKSGPNKEQDSLKRAKMFEGHFSNMNKLAALKKLVVAGPLEKNDQSYRGIFIFDVPSIEEARQLLEGDPTVKQGIFIAEYYGWYGSAALPEYMDADRRIHKNR